MNIHIIRIHSGALQVRLSTVFATSWFQRTDLSCHLYDLSRLTRHHPQSHLLGRMLQQHHLNSMQAMKMFSYM
jgi:hypothetical protein